MGTFSGMYRVVQKSTVISSSINAIKIIWYFNYSHSKTTIPKPLPGSIVHFEGDDLTLGRNSSQIDPELIKNEGKKGKLMIPPYEKVVSDKQ